jgi:hypothetical protein
VRSLDALPLGEIQSETPIRSIPTHDGVLKLANHKDESFYKIVD